MSRRPLITSAESVRRRTPPKVSHCAVILQFFFFLAPRQRELFYSHYGHWNTLLFNSNDTTMSSTLAERESDSLLFLLSGHNTLNALWGSSRTGGRTNETEESIRGDVDTEPNIERLTESAVPALFQDPPVRRVVQHHPCQWWWLWS